MKAEVDLPEKTSKENILAGLKLIYEWYQYRHDEYVPPDLTPLSLDRREFSLLTDSEYIDKARTYLEGGQLRDKLKKIEEYYEKLNKTNSQIETIDTKREEELLLLENEYEITREKLLDEIRLREQAYSSSAVYDIENLEVDYNEKRLAVNNKYSDLLNSLTIERNYLQNFIDNADEYYSEAFEKEILAKALELKEKDIETLAEVMKYNSSQTEREIKFNNALVQTEARLHIDFLALTKISLSKAELMEKGYYSDVLEWVLPYYWEWSDASAAYAEFAKETEYMVYLHDNYDQVMRYLYRRAFG